MQEPVPENPMVDRRGEWVSFPGGELEGRVPRAVCQACRERKPRVRLGAAERAQTLCFACYRAELDRQRALGQAAARSEAADPTLEERWQSKLPFEPVGVSRVRGLEAIKAAQPRRPNATAVGARTSGGVYEDLALRRRRAQIAARRALSSLAAGLESRGGSPADRRQAIDAAIRAAELQLPESWLPFVVAS